MQERAKQVAEVLKALANENRLLILCALAGGGLSAGDIGRAVPHISQSGVSQHLALLRAHGFIDSQKQGACVIYHICDERVSLLMQLLKEQYCAE